MNRQLDGWPVRPTPDLEGRVRVLEERVATLAEALRLLVSGAEPAHGMPMAQAAHQANELLIRADL